MTEEKQKLGARLRARRQAAGLKLTELGARANVSVGYLSELEQDAQQNPTLDVLLRIAKALNTTIADLLGEPEVRARLPSLDVVPEGLLQLMKEYRSHGDPLDPDTITWLAHAQFRGEKPRTKDDFASLLRSFRAFDKERP